MGDHACLYSINAFNDESVHGRTVASVFHRKHYNSNRTSGEAAGTRGDEVLRNFNSLKL